MIKFFIKKIKNSKLKGSFSFLSIPKIKQVILFSILYDTIPLVPYVNMIINQNIKSVFIIPFIFALKKAVRSILDIPVAIMIDRKIGSKKAIMIAFIFKILFVISISQNTTFFFIVASIVDGISLSFFRGKVNVLQYKIAQEYGFEEKYDVINAVYTVGVYMFTITFSALGKLLFVFYGIKAIEITSIIILTITLFTTSRITLNDSKEVGFFGHLPFFRKRKTELDEKDRIISKINQKKDFWQINYIVKAIKEVRPDVIGWSIISGVCSLGWQLNSMNQFLAIKIGNNNPVFIFQIGVICMFIGAIFSLFLRHKNTDRSIKRMFFILLFTISINIILPLFVKGSMINFGIVPYLLFYTSYENILEKKIISSSKPDMKNFITSIGTFVTSFISIFIIIMFHFIGGSLNYVIASVVVFLFLFFILTYAFSLVGMVFRKNTFPS